MQGNLLVVGMNTSSNHYDAIEAMIYSTGLRITSLEFFLELDLMIIVLNSGKVLRQSISYSKRLTGIDKASLENYRFIAGGVGVHWPDVDEDLSLKGFLLDELKRIAGKNPDRALAA